MNIQDNAPVRSQLPRSCMSHCQNDVRHAGACARQSPGQPGVAANRGTAIDTHAQRVKETTRE